MKTKTKSVRYTGAAGAECRELGAATGAGDVLEPGKVYTLPAALAEALVSSSSSFELVTGKPASPKGANDA